MDKPENDALNERLRLLINNVLERFNQENVTPQEAGMVILGLTHRLMTVLEGTPEVRRQFILNFINLVNQYLSGDFQEE